MVRRKGIRCASVAVLAVALSMQVAFAAPARLTAQLRAAGCCGTDCTRIVARTCDCCHLGLAADGPMAPPASGPWQVTALVTGPALVLAPTSDPAPLRGFDPVTVGPPLFLALRSLRL
jgi:hypothetical protein